MVPYKHQCGVSGGRGLVYKIMESVGAEGVVLYDVNTFSTLALHIFVNEISSPTYSTLIFLLYHVILCSFFPLILYPT